MRREVGCNAEICTVTSDAYSVDNVHIVFVNAIIIVKYTMCTLLQATS